MSRSVGLGERWSGVCIPTTLYSAFYTTLPCDDPRDPPSPPPIPRSTPTTTTKTVTILVPFPPLFHHGALLQLLPLLPMLTYTLTCSSLYPTSFVIPIRPLLPIPANCARYCLQTCLYNLPHLLLAIPRITP